MISHFQPNCSRDIGFPAKLVTWYSISRQISHVTTIFPPKTCHVITDFPPETCLVVPSLSRSKMENCDIKHVEIRKSVATRNVTSNALLALFGIEQGTSCYLKDSLDTYIFPVENGVFPSLEAYATYVVEVQVQQPEAVKCKKRHVYVSDDSSDSDVFHGTAYKLATKKLSKNAKEQKIGKSGKWPVPSSASATSTAQDLPASTWYFKVTVGEWKNKKIVPLRNSLLKVNDASECTQI